jgi:hypothetical protein
VVLQPLLSVVVLQPLLSVAAETQSFAIF